MERLGAPCVIYEKALRVASAAQQRNLGAEHVRAPIVGFTDGHRSAAGYRRTDRSRLCRGSRAKIGGIAARITDIHRPPPSRLTRLYLRWQAGFDDPTYGGRLFGPAINCLPCYTETEEDLIPADWLNSGCVFYRTELFLRETKRAELGLTDDVLLVIGLGRMVPHLEYGHRGLGSREP